MGQNNRAGDGDGVHRSGSWSGFPVTLFLGMLLALHLGILSMSKPLAAANPAPFRILHVMSYHTPWKWTEDQLQGFKDALSGLRVDYRVFEMDTKRHSTKAWKERTGAAARTIIEDWRPDLVYVSDDNAQQYVTRHYLNDDIPFVFSGVNEAPSKYGFDGAENITGVLEQEHAAQTLRLLKSLVPGVEKIAVIVDEGPTWPKVIERLRARVAEIDGLDVVSWNVIHSFEDYKSKVMDLQDKVDAIGNLGIFTYKDRRGNNVPYQDVLRWTADNSRLPDFSFWLDRVDHGTLCAVGVSGYQQGYVAGGIARRILVDGEKPSAIPMRPTVKGEPWVNLARLRRLGLPYRSTPLLSSRVVTTFRWDRQ